MIKYVIIFFLIFTFTKGSLTFAQQKETEVIHKVKTFWEPSNPLRRTLQNVKEMEKQYRQEQMQVDSETYKILENLKNPFIPQIPIEGEEELPTPEPQKVNPIATSTPQQILQNEIPEIPIPKFSIAGLVWNTERPQAIINNQVYNVGDAIQNWTIIEIKKEGIELRFRNQSFFVEK